MSSVYVYHPMWFYGIVMSFALFHSVIVAYISSTDRMRQLQVPLLLLALLVPCVTALGIIFSSEYSTLTADFWHRLFLFNISPFYLMIIFFLMPFIVCLATGLSLLFGYSTEQFSVSEEFAISKSSSLFGVMFPLLFAPLFEEIGWRGYGVDSLGAYFDLFTTSVLFGFLWGIWHLPGFFVKGLYHNKLWYQGKIYVLNFFVSFFSLAFLMNWVYYKVDRSIPALILFHSVVNFSSMILRTKQFTKCIVTCLLTLTAILLIAFDGSFFFSYMYLT